jgi:glycosyltransferase involved in cell wall biosynthesis
VATRLDVLRGAPRERWAYHRERGGDTDLVTRLLFHSYHFPPIGGSGAQRPLKMVRALAELGYDSVVITSGGATTNRWAPEDATLLAEIPAQVEIRRVPNADEPETSHAQWKRFSERWLGAREPWTRWWTDRSYRLGLEAGNEVDLIYVWMQPYDSAEVGAALAKALDKPWVADLGDPWALDEMMIYPSGLHRRFALRRMGELLGTASAIVMSTPEAVARLLANFPELRGRTVVAIPNGFDADDFGGKPVLQDETFRIVHTGYLHTELGLQHRRRRLLRRALRGSVKGLDILTRSHVFLVEAINELLAEEPSLSDVLELHLAGVTNDADREVALECPVAVLHGYMTHAESIELMHSADLLFLPMQNLPPGVRATIVPGKTYEYLASGRPILAAVPDGDAREILESAGNAMVVRPDDVDGMAAAIIASLDRKRSGAPAPTPDAELVERFDYGRLAKDLAGVFDAVLGKRGLAAAERSA